MDLPERKNEYGQAIGAPVDGWTPRPLPSREAMLGRFCRLEALDPERHGTELHEAFAADPDARHWTWLPYGPWDSAEDYVSALHVLNSLADTVFYTIVCAASSRPVGVAAYLRIDPTHGTIEVGHLRFSSQLQRRPAATEAMFLMMRHAFEDLGYRRYEWRCDSRNKPSLAAAQRLGFRFEGTFRQAMVIKGRNRDTSWLSVLDGEWPVLREAFERWLAPANFDPEGRQRTSLSGMRALLLSGREG